MLVKNQIYEAEITDYTAEGQGVAHIEGCAVFIPNAVAGEKVRVRVEKAQKTWAAGKIVEILEKSPHRVNRECEVAKLCGERYSMDIHGFAKDSVFTIEEQSSDSVTFCLRQTPETLRQYPFRFTFRVRYALRGWTVHVTYSVCNEDEKELPFGIGGHPGFRVPLTGSTGFEDYKLCFSQPCLPDRIGFTGDCYLNGQTECFPLEDDTTIRLRHELFDEDAIVLKNMARCVSLCSEKTGKSVTVAYPQMPYLGIWHMPHTDAPYVCIEPWASLPSRQDVVEELSCKSDLIHLAPGAKYENQWSITITEEKECMM